jgi:hypothetical protein
MFVEDPSRFSRKETNDLRYRIKKKLKKAVTDLEFLLQRKDDAGIDLGELLDLIGTQDNAGQKTSTSGRKVLQSQKKATTKYKPLSALENW